MPNTPDKTTTSTSSTTTSSTAAAKPAAARPSTAKPRARAKPRAKTSDATKQDGPPKPDHPKGTPDPAPNVNTDPVLRVRDPELATSAGAVDERFDLVGADGRNVLRALPYQTCADEAARISGVTGEKLEIVRTGEAAREAAKQQDTKS